MKWAGLSVSCEVVASVSSAADICLTSAGLCLQAPPPPHTHPHTHTPLNLRLLLVIARLWRLGLLFEETVISVRGSSHVLSFSGLRVLLHKYAKLDAKLD